MKILVSFQPQNRFDNFEGARMRKTIKGALEINDIPYTTNLLDTYDIAHFMCAEDDLKLLEVESKNIPIVISALYSEKDRTAFYLQHKNTKKEEIETLRTRAIKVLNRADLVLVPCESAKKLLVDSGVTSPIETLMPGVNFARFNFVRDDEKEIFYRYHKEEKGKKLLVSIGELGYIEGLKTFVEIAKKNPDVKCWFFGIAGRYPKHNLKVKKIIRFAPRNAHFATCAPDDVYRSALMNADVMVINSTTKFGVITLMDAIAAKCQIVVNKAALFDGFLTNKVNAYVGDNNQDIVKLTSDYLKGKIKPTIDQAFLDISSNTLQNYGLKLIDLYKKEIKNKKGEKHND